MKYIAEWASEQTGNDSTQWESHGEIISNQEEMRRSGEEMRERRAIGEFENELLEYIQGEIPQWAGFNNGGPTSYFEK